MTNLTEPIFMYKHKIGDDDDFMRIIYIFPI